MFKWRVRREGDVLPLAACGSVPRSNWLASMSEQGDVLLTRFLGVDPELTTQPALEAFLSDVSVDRANRFAWAIKRHVEQLDVAGLARLVKVFTLLENLPGTWFCRGSTSQVHALLRELSRRDVAAAKEATTWAFKTAKNPYNPFGTYNVSRGVAADVNEYHELERLRFAKIRETEATRSIAAKVRAEARAHQHGSRLASHAQYNAARARLHRELAALTPTERLVRIVAEPSWRLGALPEEFADQSAASELDEHTLGLLRSRLARAPRGRWQRLRDVL